MLPLAKKFLELFKGNGRAHGVYTADSSPTAGLKVDGRAITVTDPVTVSLWVDHLEGGKGLGIIPIRDDATCFFGAIDIDKYDGLDYKETIARINALDLPLVPCRSKSGGMHLFVFTSEGVPAALVRGKLLDFAAALGFGETEVFPKQVEVIADRGDLGQWINMPYFDIKKTTRYGLNKSGKQVTPEAFLKTAFSLRKTKKELEAISVVTISDMSDGPPCLQFLLQQGFEPGTRNDGLFNIGVYLRKSQAKGWESAIDDYNVRFMKPPLSSSEVQAVIKSLRRRSYNYMCQQPPLKPHCNTAVCRGRKFGAHENLGMPILTGLTKYDAQPPIWFVDLEGGGRLELMTEELQSQIRFQRRCMESLNLMPARIREDAWQAMVQQLMEKTTIIEAPREASIVGQFIDYLERFCTSRAQARVMDEILLGKPFTGNGYHYFRLSDLLAFLERNRFREFKANKVASVLRDLRAEHQFVRVKGRGINIWKIPEFEKQTENFEIPKMPDGDIL